MAGTFRTTVKNDKGEGIPDLLVSANDLLTGALYSRSTDGGGYADVATQDAAVGNRVTFSVLDPQYRYKGHLAGDAYEMTKHDQVIDLVLQPFS